MCAAKGPRPRYPRVWKSKQRIGTISKAAKLVQCVKGLSNVKEEVYGTLDAFVAWELEFPLVTVKKALKTLESEGEWKRIIQLAKWMFSKGQGRTMGSYFMLLKALSEDDRLEEAEELWSKLLMQYLESLPRIFFDKMVSVYYHRRMHEKMFEVFADMEELGVKPSISTVQMVGRVFKELDMLDKYEKLHKKYPPPKWEYRYYKGKRVRIQVKNRNFYVGVNSYNKHEESVQDSYVEEPETTEQDQDTDELNSIDSALLHQNNEPPSDAESEEAERMLHKSDALSQQTQSFSDAAYAAGEKW